MDWRSRFDDENDLISYLDFRLGKIFPDGMTSDQKQGHDLQRERLLALYRAGKEVND